MRNLILITGAALMITYSTAYAEPTPTPAPNDFNTTFAEWTSGGGGGVDLTSATDVATFEQSVEATFENHQLALEGLRAIVEQQQQLIEDLQGQLATAVSDIQDQLDDLP